QHCAGEARRVRRAPAVPGGVGGRRSRARAPAADRRMTQTVASAAILGAIAIAALRIAVRSPFDAFCVFVATLPFENALAFHGPLTVTPACVSLMLAA